MRETEQNTERVCFQHIMNYKAYRRKMIAVRVSLTVLVAGAAACLCIYSIVLGIIFAAMVLCFGAISVLAALGREETYIVFDTRFVIKHAEKRVSVPLENLLSVKYKRAFYEKKLATGTITLTATDPKSGKKKTYRMKHVFDAKACVKFLKDAADKDAQGEQSTKESVSENIRKDV